MDIFNHSTACIFRNIIALVGIKFLKKILKIGAESQQINNEPIFCLENLIAY